MALMFSKKAPSNLLKIPVEPSLLSQLWTEYDSDAENTIYLHTGQFNWHNMFGLTDESVVHKMTSLLHHFSCGRNIYSLGGPRRHCSPALQFSYLSACTKDLYLPQYSRHYLFIYFSSIERVLERSTTSSRISLGDGYGNVIPGLP